ncbi:hypothetical protein SAMN05660649_04143 [Desulfotomaculum arcticum]|uniref:Uncharacterized protein n=1 Tax=Desulfotruncus arcticus DSM 17038 TaxID=1121424 RepID=A0A1I2XZH7_9FIRM|nr:hypothetical protein SAMN05660649_04143 [Desulfotomaculum arcticum] [Desulfotruncus arcticus DSM 17038]
MISLTAAKTPASTGGSLSGDKLEISATKVQVGAKPHLNQVFFMGDGWQCQAKLGKGFFIVPNAVESLITVITREYRV